MTTPKSPLPVLGVTVLFYTVGLVGHVLPPFLPLMLFLTPWFLVAAGGLVFATYAWGSDPRSLLFWFVPVFLVTFVLEITGVSTGWIFGSYHYQTTLGSLLWGVPPVIGLNWVLVVLGMHTASLAIVPRGPRWVRVLAVGMACVLFDLLLEPVAIALGYWVWHSSTVPVQNYLAWGVIAAGGAWWAEKFPLPRSLVLGWYALIQATFFLALGLFGIRA